MLTVDIDELINSDNTNESVIQLDNYICEPCSYGDELDRLSIPQRTFYFNQQLEREINNGGFDQFFFNSMGDYARETVESLNAIGAIATAQLLESAIAEFPDSIVPKDIISRRERMLELWPNRNASWDEKDSKFFEYVEDLNGLNMAYVSANRDSFR